ncbi:hypothetical protein FQN57_000672 [Myotisia sp. PD_48]|nr:hypothetical protein FQN57_000672 [Myotisia sp. PD_48]
MPAETTGGLSRSSNTTGATGSSTGSSGATPNPAGSVGHGIKDIAAGIHGAGEKIRGNVGAAVDRAANDPEGAAKNELVSDQGEREMKTGKFSQATKEKEGLHHVSGSSH